jgi:hypothetical protein
MYHGFGRLRLFWLVGSTEFRFLSLPAKGSSKLRVRPNGAEIFQVSSGPLYNLQVDALCARSHLMLATKGCWIEGGRGGTHESKRMLATMDISVVFVTQTCN